MADSELDGLLAEQIAYYRTRAGEYDATYPLDTHADAGSRAQLLAAMERHAPYGRVLELACGTGQWTAELARHATTVTAVDAAPEALAICRRRVEGAAVHLVEADLFTWRPRERYDFVFFSAWLSHVPPQRFDDFWALVADCLTPDGRVFVIDELPAVATVEHPAPGQPAPAVRRELTTGQAFRAVKVLHSPDELRASLGALGWDTDIATVGWRFFHASLRRR
ncbi:class I SAM-dependent methyltransferase [Actinoplanes sp. CA-252034]|uniref:class I SAM-dependent methyltransferase n=1 Tax=Actinoplanes sp. CA-252034 TaxID=3239906 RepID=UPI003D9706E8